MPQHPMNRASATAIYSIFGRAVLFLADGAPPPDLTLEISNSRVCLGVRVLTVSCASCKAILFDPFRMFGN